MRTTLRLLAGLTLLLVSCTDDGASGPLVLPTTTTPSFEPGSQEGMRERPHKLLTHCGLSYPTEFQRRFWLPVERRFRKTINPPDGFTSDGYYDRGTMRIVDDDTVIYTSSEGVRVEYEPTDRPGGGCE